MERSTKVSIATMSLFAVVFVTFVVVLFVYDTEEFQPIREPVLVGIVGIACINLALLILSEYMRRMEATKHDS